VLKSAISRSPQTQVVLIYVKCVFVVMPSWNPRKRGQHSAVGGEGKLEVWQNQFRGVQSRSWPRHQRTSARYCMYAEDVEHKSLRCNRGMIFTLAYLNKLIIWLGHNRVKVLIFTRHKLLFCYRMQNQRLHASFYYVYHQASFHFKLRDHHMCMIRSGSRGPIRPLRPHWIWL